MATTQREKRAGDIVLISPNDIVIEDGFNVREAYDGIEDLALSLLNEGQVNNIKVYKYPKGHENHGKYVVRVGHRRTLAGQHIVNTMGEADFMLKAEKLKTDDLTANLLLQWNSQSETPLNEVEKANLIFRLRSLENDGVRMISDEEIQNRLGISVAQMYNLLAIVDAPKTVKAAIVNDEISMTTVNAIIRQNATGRGSKRVVDFDAIENTVVSLVEEAKTSTSTKGKKGAKVTGANLKGNDDKKAKSGSGSNPQTTSSTNDTKDRQQSLEAKIGDLRKLVKDGVSDSEVIANFIEVLEALETQTAQEVLASYQ